MLTVDDEGNVYNNCGKKLKKRVCKDGYAYVIWQGNRVYVTDLVMSQLYPDLADGLTIRHIDYTCRACDIFGSHEIVVGTSTRIATKVEPRLRRTQSGKYEVWQGTNYLGTYADFDFAIMVGENPDLAMVKTYEQRKYKPRVRKEYRPRGRRMKRRK